MIRFRFPNPFSMRAEEPRLPPFDLERDPAGVVRELRDLLENRLLPFWCTGIADRERGGYDIPGLAEGGSIDQSKRFLVFQARTVWFFAHLAESRYGGDEHLALARHGYDYLTGAMRDEAEGGYFWKIDRDSGRPLIPDKHLYGQSFALLAFARYAKASGDGGAAERAAELLRLIEATRDRRSGGYLESVDRAWNLLPPGDRSCIGLPCGIKSLNTHLHLLESYNAAWRVAPDGRTEERVAELANLLSTKCVRVPPGACPQMFTPEWEPISKRGRMRVSYGHDLELSWILLAAAADIPSIPRRETLAAATALAGHALEHGFDRKRGGICESGRPGRPADRRDKIWWVQAEGLLAMLHLHRLTGESRYASAFSRLLSWIAGAQLNRETGHWHHRIDGRGRAHGYRAGEWKTAYHNGRALLDCLELLSSRGGQDAPDPGDGNR